MYPAQAPHDRLGSPVDLSHVRVTGGQNGPSLRSMPKEWPAAEFQEYLRTRMRAAGISGEPELAELSGVSQNQLSTWRLARNQPTLANLRRIAPVVKTPPYRLFLAAGLLAPHDLDRPEQPDVLADLPAELRELIALYNDRRLSADQRSYARRIAADVTAGLRAELARSEVRPTGRRRAG